MKDSVEVQSPSRDPFFVVLRVEKARNSISLAQLDNVPLDLRHDPTTKGAVSRLDTIHISVGSIHDLSDTPSSTCPFGDPPTL